MDVAWTVVVLLEVAAAALVFIGFMVVLAWIVRELRRPD